jgi:hypothetical protein
MRPVLLALARTRRAPAADTTPLALTRRTHVERTRLQLVRAWAMTSMLLGLGLLGLGAVVVPGLVGRDQVGLGPVDRVGLGLGGGVRLVRRLGGGLLEGGGRRLLLLLCCW